MSGQTIKLSVLKRNKFQNTQYVEDDNGTCDLPVTEVFWTIKSPSESLKDSILQLIPGATIYTCSSGEYILSPKASTVIKEEGAGSGCAIRLSFYDPNGKKWCLMSVDNKPYAQHVQGIMDKGETDEQCIIRETKEETNIDLSNKVLIKWAKYSFLGGNELVDCHWPVETNVFCATLQWNDVSHLFPHPLVDNTINIVNVDEYDFKLDETQFILAIPEDVNILFPSTIEEIRKTKPVNGIIVDVPLEFGNHHRALFDYFINELPTPKFPYLHTFEIFKRQKDIFPSDK